MKIRVIAMAAAMVSIASNALASADLVTWMPFDFWLKNDLYAYGSTPTQFVMDWLAYSLGML